MILKDLLLENLTPNKVEQNVNFENTKESDDRLSPRKRVPYNEQFNHFTLINLLNKEYIEIQKWMRAVAEQHICT